MMFSKNIILTYNFLLNWPSPAITKITWSYAHMTVNLRKRQYLAMKIQIEASLHIYLDDVHHHNLSDRIGLYILKRQQNFTSTFVALTTVWTLFRALACTVQLTTSSMLGVYDIHLLLARYMLYINYQVYMPWLFLLF